MLDEGNHEDFTFRLSKKNIRGVLLRSILQIVPIDEVKQDLLDMGFMGFEVIANSRMCKESMKLELIINFSPTYQNKPK